MMHLMGTPAKPQTKPKPRAKKIARDPIAVVEEAARVGDARFQYFLETGALRRSKCPMQRSVQHPPLPQPRPQP